MCLSRCVLWCCVGLNKNRNIAFYRINVGAHMFLLVVLCVLCKLLVSYYRFLAYTCFIPSVLCLVLFRIIHCGLNIVSYHPFGAFTCFISSVLCWNLFHIIHVWTETCFIHNTTQHNTTQHHEIEMGRDWSSTICCGISLLRSSESTQTLNNC